jgi:signal transduction histidine kinase
VDKLAPIVSPMIASARVLHRIHNRDLKIVFIGPCIAKKGEGDNEDIHGEVETAITFTELRKMLDESGITSDAVEPSEFDPPHAGTGGLFSISRGLLQSADIHEDLITGEVVAAEGRTNFVGAIKEFQSGDLDAKLLEVLCCNGCIMGAGMSTDAPLFSRRSQVSRYVRERMDAEGQNLGTDRLEEFDDLDLTRTYTPSDQRLEVPFEEEIRMIMARMGKTTPEDELNCGACGYDTCREHAIAIFKGLAENEMCLPNTIERLRSTIDELANSNNELASVQEALMQSEKLASMGQLAAGIAHEVNNPLGVVLMYAHLLLDEYKDDSTMQADLSMIAEQADRCKKIVAGLLHFARQNKVLLQTVNLRQLIERGIKSVTIPENIKVVAEDTLKTPIIEVDPDQILQVLTNLISNSIAAMPDGGTMTISTSRDKDRIKLVVSDTGVGIIKENLKKIFEPFFTTKQIGKGTGLGLAVTYGIVKMHRGDISVESNADRCEGPTGTTFTVTLPWRETTEITP